MCRFFLLLIGCFLFNAAQSATELLEHGVYSVANSKVKLRLGRIEEEAPKTLGNRATKFTFHILDNVAQPNDFLGQLIVTWHPAENLSNARSQQSFFSIDNIYIGREATADEPLHPQKQGYGTEAMSLLFTILRKSPLYEKGIEVKLECPSTGHLPGWYESFGFQQTIILEAEGKQSMSCSLDKAAKKGLKKVAWGPNNQK